MVNANIPIDPIFGTVKKIDKAPNAEIDITDYLAEGSDKVVLVFREPDIDVYYSALRKSTDPENGVRGIRAQTTGKETEAEVGLIIAMMASCLVSPRAENFRSAVKSFAYLAETNEDAFNHISATFTKAFPKFWNLAKQVDDSKND